jgi:alanine racemase
LEAFYYAVKDLNGIDIHFAASSLIDGKVHYQNCRRVGDILYHGALLISGKILKVNYINKGEYIGYDYSYQMKKNSYVGIIDIGYADGLERNCNGFSVCINNKYYYLIGKACMNSCFVLLNDEKVNVGSEVFFISCYNNILNYQQFFGKISHEIYLSFLKK